MKNKFVHVTFNEEDVDPKFVEQVAALVVCYLEFFGQTAFVETGEEEEDCEEAPDEA
jgi:hypothetical protein